MRIEGRDLRAVWWEGDEESGHVVVIDQRRLPHEIATVAAGSVAEVAAAIKNMTVRGAPTIGATAAYGMVLGLDDPVTAAKRLGAARPTARDLFDALSFMQAEGGPSLGRAQRYVDQILVRCEALGRHGRELLVALAGSKGRPVRMLTHCHAGALATVDHGTALAPLHALVRDPVPGVEMFVWVDETRPRLQGAITAWELATAGIEHAVIADNAAGHLMARGQVDVVITGADRVAANGDVANKIGTYTKAVLAARHGIPFYVAIPASTFDASCPSGADIEIEQRDPDEVLSLGGQRLHAPGTQARNPAFDVTPAELVRGYITERGVLSADKLAALSRATTPAA